MEDARRQDRAIIISMVALLLAGLQAYLSYSQIQDLRHQFELSGAVLSVESSAQLKFNDDSREPLNLPEEQHPILTTQHFQTYDVIYLVFKVTNLGRLDTTLLGAKLRIGGRDTIIKEDDPQAKNLCSTQGSDLLECRREFNSSPPRLSPGQSYYFYFPLKDFWDGRRVAANLQGEISATGLQSKSIQFPVGIGLNRPPSTSSSSLTDVVPTDLPPDLPPPR